MPEVGIFQSPEMNAFATGARRDAALVAVSTGLLRRHVAAGSRGGLGHEVSHVANGDMVTLTLIQGVVNTFVIFIARIVGHFVDRVLRSNEEGHGIGYFFTVIVAEIVLGLFASMIVMGSRGIASFAPTAAAPTWPARRTWLARSSASGCRCSAASRGPARQVRDVRHQRRQARRGSAACS